jgi:hypothetical protein
MSECAKKQHENYKGTQRTRCINREADLFKQVVVPGQCAACPFAKAKYKKPEPCAKAYDPGVVTRTGTVELPVVEPRRDPGFPDCPFRYDIGGKMFCGITSLPVDAEICGRCEETTRDETAKFGDKVVHYLEAIRKWVAKGRPTRSKEEVEKLFRDHCQGCDRYDKEKHACKTCGCQVSDANASPLKNKLAMATEHCPLGRF